MERMDFDATLSSIIMSTLDDVDAGEIPDIIQLLKSVGVKKMCHIKYVQESDLISHLNRIQARMLIESFKSAAAVSDDNTVPQTYTVVPEAPSHSFISVAQVPSEIIPVCASSRDELVQISWHLLPKHLNEKLQNSKDLRPSEFRDIVRVIADDILRMNANPPKKLVLKVAEVCTKKFPVLKDTLEGLNLGTGFDNLSHRVYTRIENMRRKTNILNKQNNEDSPPIKKRRVQIDSYGCVAWSPNLPETVTEEELQRKKDILKEICTETQVDKAIELLEDTYFLQRAAINTNAAIGELLKDWPALFIERGIEAHFKILTDIDLYKVLEETVSSKGRQLLSYFRSSSQDEVKKFMSETDMNILNPNELLLVVLAMGHYFKESSSTVFFTSEIFNPHEPFESVSSIPKHPCLVGKGTSLLRCEEFMLVIDGVAVNSTIKDPAVAVASWFAAYYIFNIVYPNEFSCTLECIQRCFVGINPVCGSKAERKKGKKLYQGVHPRILTLLKKLQQFDSWLNDCRK